MDVTSFTSEAIALGNVRFVHDGGEDLPSFSITANDGFSDSNTRAGTVTFTNVNDQPVVDMNGETPDVDNSILNFNGTPVLIAPTAAIIDPDSTIQSMTAHHQFYRPDGPSESLSLNTVPPAGLNVTYDPDTGILTISGAASPLTYQTILQSVQYNDTARARRPCLTRRFSSQLMTAIRIVISIFRLFASGRPRRLLRGLRLISLLRGTTRPQT